MTIDAFVQRMLAMFGPPNTADPETFIAETRKALNGWRPDILAEAADRIVKTAKWFPKPAEVIEVCEAIAAGKTSNADHGARNQDWTADALKTADYLIQSDMGRQAANEGWITQLHDYCRKHRELPPGRIVGDLRHEARLFEDAYGSVAAGDGGALQGALKVLGDSMLVRRNELAEIASRGAGLTAQSRRMSGETE